MALYYCDTSALVKYYVTEPGSTWVRQLIEERDAETSHFRYIILRTMRQNPSGAG
jgi:predicted nucleic acid-binding protein